ncbi:MAG TPA: TolC family protein [Gemmatimonadales bacterium]|jgi:outer membrane protein|nr:TolC family protein [Gemmatimonadales bacterium]
MPRVTACRLLSAAAAATLLLPSCTPPLPGPGGGAPAAAPAPHVKWTPPPEAPAPVAAPAPGIPPELAERIQRLTMGDVVDLALRGNPATAQAWANARAAAAAYGASKSAYYPTLDGDVSGTRIKTAATSGRVAVIQTVYGPSATLSWLLWDFGGRSGAIESARQALLAADWTHNATISDVVLQAQVAFFNYIATGALLTAQRASVKDAQANLDAAEARRQVGAATIADVLQARTALSQAQLSLDTLEGSRLTARGALAVSLGLNANVPYDVDSVRSLRPIAAVSDSVEAIINRAVRERPDLAAARADAAAAQARIREIRGSRLPSITATGTAGYTDVVNRGSAGTSYNIGLGLAIPLFNGFGREYSQKQAEYLADAAVAQQRSLEQQVTYQVFSAYYALQTATRRVQTSNDLVASAAQSTEVALARYKAGVGTVLDLLAAQGALASARSQVVQSRLAWYISLAQLAHDAGALDPKGGTDLRLSPDTVESIPQETIPQR